MKYKVRIKNTPMQKAREGMQVDYGLDNPVTAMGGGDTRSAKSDYTTTRSIIGVPRDEANLEAEGGETVYGDLNGDGMPEQNTIKGPRHSEGGVPLNLPEGTFIFSDTKSMRIKDCEILQMFNKPCGKKSYTPATLAKVFDLNAYREILQDPESDKLDVRTAERMLKNYTIKLGALALAQESLKGFPQGIPAVAEPYIQAAGINPDEVMPPKEMTQLKDTLEKEIAQQQQPQANPEMMARAQEMNQGNPIAAPTSPQQQGQQMMPPQMQQPQEMLGQPMPGMMPPQEQMMAMGGAPMMDENPPSNQYKLYNKQGVVTGTVPSGQDYLDAHPNYRVGKSGTLYTDTGDLAGKGFGEFYKAPDHIPFSKMGSRTLRPDEMRYGGLHKFIDGGEPCPEGFRKDALGNCVDNTGDNYTPPSVPEYPDFSNWDNMGPMEQRIIQLQMESLPESFDPMDIEMYGIKEAKPGDVPNIGGGQRMVPMTEFEYPQRPYDESTQRAIDYHDEVSRQGFTKDNRVFKDIFLEKETFDKPISRPTMAYGGAKQKVRITETPLRKAKEGEIVIKKSEFTNNGVFDEYAYEQAIFEAVNRGDVVTNESGQVLDVKNQEVVELSWDDKYDPNGAYSSIYGTEDPNNPGTFTMSDEQKMIAAQAYLTEKYFNEPKTKAFLAREIREAASDSNNYSGKSVSNILDEYNTANGTTVTDIADIPDDALVQALIDQNTQALKIKAKGIDPRAFINSATGFKSDNDIISAGIINPVTGEKVTDAAGVAALKSAYTDLGVTNGNLNAAYGDPDKRGMEQLAYLGFMKANADLRDGTLTGDDLFAARYLDPQELGEGDEALIYGSKTTTPIDFFEGNTDLGQTAAAKFTKFNFIDKPKPDQTKQPCLCPDPDNEGEFLETERDENGDCICNQDRIVTKNPPRAEWWLQDTINTFGALGDASMIQKQQPWDTTVDLKAPISRYDDPTKELDSNLGLYRQTADTLAQFTGPQGLTSRMSQARGQAAKSAADITKRYNTRNLALANAQEVRSADTANKEALMNREVNKGLYDATMLADERFNKEKMAARVNRRGLYNQAITNRAKTQALNSMYPDYAVDPASGGFMMHTPNQRNPSATSSNLAKRKALMDQYISQGMDGRDAAAAVNAIYGSPSSGSTSSSAPNAIMAQYENIGRSNQSYRKTGGEMPYYIYGGNVYPF
jgi:hypothetical protein